MMTVAALFLYMACLVPRCLKAALEDRLRPAEQEASQRRRRDAESEASARTTASVEKGYFRCPRGPVALNSKALTPLARRARSCAARSDPSAAARLSP